MLRPITCEELLDVELATKGETTTHRRWPRELVEVWLAAEVINVAAEQRRTRARRDNRRSRALRFVPALFAAPPALVFSRRPS